MKQNILDLRPIISETLDVILSEDRSLHLRKPSEALVMRIAEQMQRMFTESDAEDDEESADTTATDEQTAERIRSLNLLVADTLSNNTDGETITMEWVQGVLPLGAKVAILQAYSEFAMKLSDNPN